MVDSKDIITFPDGSQYITTATAAKLLNLHIRRIRQFIERGALEAIQLEEGGSFYISLKTFEIFAKTPRKPGRPSTKTADKAGKKAAKKGAKK